MTKVFPQQNVDHSEEKMKASRNEIKHCEKQINYSTVTIRLMLYADLCCFFWVYVLSNVMQNILLTDTYFAVILSRPKICILLQFT